MSKICILDYGAGNVASVYNIIKYLGFNCIISKDSEEIKKSSHIILPGVGAYSSLINKLKKNIDIENLSNEILIKKKPFLGICVGMQILSTKGSEFNECKGLNWIEGDVKIINNKKLPHIGWNSVDLIKKSEITENLENNQDFYFVNSFFFKTKNKEDVIAKTQYNQTFSSIIQKKNIFGVQFHPEKSQKAGQLLIKNFCRLK
tara:strand:+ start:4337 stop:4945 length:609 start_codon:yes stop_codon:yes gene_type:complete